MEELQQLLAMLGVKTFAEAAASISNFNSFLEDAKKVTAKGGSAEALTALQAFASLGAKVEKATGKVGDEAHGVVLAAIASHTELPKAQTRIAELEQTTNAQAFEQLVAKAKDEKKLSPAQEKNAREAFAKGELTLKGAEFHFSNLHPIAALQQRDPAPPAPPAPSEALKHEGKTFEEMSGRERQALMNSNRDLYNAMRSAAGL